jgi:tetratricopeptide (TPR) repeat protein
MCCVRAGAASEAEAAYRAAVKADPSFASAWYNLADVLDDQRRIDEAIECLKRALGADPTYADAIFNTSGWSGTTRRRGGGGVISRSRAARRGPSVPSAP